MCRFDMFVLNISVLGQLLVIGFGTFGTVFIPFGTKSYI